MRTIIIKIQGGLGNQMFQYAFARALQDCGYAIRFDTSLYTPSNTKLQKLKQQIKQIFKGGGA